MNTNHTILLVEDEIESGEMLANFLEINNFNVHWAKDGKEALNIIENNANDLELAVLDIMVPHMDGKEICKHIRKHPVINEIPVLFLTARDEEKDEIEGLQLGGDDYIKKPASLNLIKPISKRCFGAEIRRSRNGYGMAMYISIPIPTRCTSTINKSISPIPSM